MIFQEFLPAESTLVVQETFPWRNTWRCIHYAYSCWRGFSSL